MSGPTPRPLAAAGALFQRWNVRAEALGPVALGRRLGHLEAAGQTRVAEWPVWHTQLAYPLLSLVLYLAQDDVIGQVLDASPDDHAVERDRSDRDRAVVDDGLAA